MEVRPAAPFTQLVQLGFVWLSPFLPSRLHAPWSSAWLHISEGSIRLVCSWHLWDDHSLRTTATPLRYSLVSTQYSCMCSKLSCSQLNKRLN